MNIGNIELGDRPLFLAPMEDVTDASFRFICKEFGADMMYTEFISSDGLIRDARKGLYLTRFTNENEISDVPGVGYRVEFFYRHQTSLSFQPSLRERTL